jgi:RNA polymerase sigma factor (sigma-70 family)
MSGGATAEFERIYRANAGAITGYFARRCTDPHTVADLTADTFVQAITSFGTFDPRRGSARAWVFGIARRVFASYCETFSHQQDKVRRLASRRELDADEVDELLNRIDAERSGRHLITELESFPALDRAVVELVDLAGLQPKEAAGVLGISRGAARTRLMRARARLRNITTSTDIGRNDDD